MDISAKSSTGTLYFQSINTYGVLLDAISRIPDDALYEIENKLNSKTEKVLIEKLPMELRKLYTHLRKTELEAAQADAVASFGLTAKERTEASNRANEYGSDAEVFHRIFWLEVRKIIADWSLGEEELDIREGYQIVKAPVSEPEPDDD